MYQVRGGHVPNPFAAIVSRFLPRKKNKTKSPQTASRAPNNFLVHALQSGCQLERANTQTNGCLCYWVCSSGAGVRPSGGCRQWRPRLKVRFYPEFCIPPVAFCAKVGPSVNRAVKRLGK